MQASWRNGPQGTEKEEKAIGLLQQQKKKSWKEGKGKGEKNYKDRMRRSAKYEYMLGFKNKGI